MRLEILQVRDCPNVPVLEERIRQATADQELDDEITHRVIDDPATASAAGMTGSPTLLVDGHDPFAAPGHLPSVSCRLYESENGGMPRGAVGRCAASRTRTRTPWIQPSASTATSARLSLALLPAPRRSAHL
ncbi:alkylmercury lyase [Mycobacterium gordonae]|jgi:hypothetical protein|uniref:alkylmercury lyase n=1 Tax=Mycobacterium gordonae TaxID=1778 RepID=UPI000AE9EE9F|nr:alkylmercury lyase [Mycobacterium gordonae]